MVKLTPLNEIRLDGNNLALDFINTVHDRKKTPVDDYLLTFEDIVTWARIAGIINTVTKDGLLQLTSDSIGNRILKKSLEVREFLYNLFLNIINQGEISPVDLESFNSVLAKCLPNLCIKKTKQGNMTAWKQEPGDIFVFLSPVLFSAYQLLISDHLEKVRECPSCGWLFLDLSKNGKRKWCSMATCGSNAKAMDWYNRKKKRGA